MTAFESPEVAQLWVDLMMNFDDDFYRSGTVTETDGVVQVVFIDLYERPVLYSSPMGILQWAQLSQLPALVHASMTIINGGTP